MSCLSYFMNGPGTLLLWKDMAFIKHNHLLLKLIPTTEKAKTKKVLRLMKKQYVSATVLLKTHVSGTRNFVNS